MSDPIFRDEDDPGRPMPADGTPWSVCLRCRSPQGSLGVTELRTGGMGGAAHLLLGQWAEVGEGKLSVELFHCDTCGHIELRAAA